MHYILTSRKDNQTEPLSLPHAKDPLGLFLLHLAVKVPQVFPDTLQLPHPGLFILLEQAKVFGFELFEFIFKLMVPWV